MTAARRRALIRFRNLWPLIVVPILAMAVLAALSLYPFSSNPH